MESTWATIKREIRHIHGDWTQLTRSQLRTILFDYIETPHQPKMSRPWCRWGWERNRRVVALARREAVVEFAGELVEEVA